MAWRGVASGLCAGLLRTSCCTQLMNTFCNAPSNGRAVFTTAAGEGARGVVSLATRILASLCAHRRLPPPPRVERESLTASIPK